MANQDPHMATPMETQGHAAATHAEQAATAHHDDHGHHGGYWANPEVWVALSVITFFVLFGKIIWKAFGHFLDQRGLMIRDQLEEARQLREDAQEALAEYKRRQKEAMKEAERIIQNAKTQAEELQKRMEDDMEQSMKRRQQQALEKIAASEAKAMREVRNQAVDIAIHATRKILQEKGDSLDQKPFLDEAIEAFAAKKSA